VEGLWATLKGVELANRACRSLQLAPKTVRNPASSVFAKLQVADRALNATPKIR
jgi:hypothetical protein